MVHPFEYSDTVVDHYENPRNVGEAPGANAVATAGNPECGDLMRLSLRIGPGGIIEQAHFRAFGCVAAIAASSMTTEILRGMDVESASAVTDEQVAQALGGLPPSKVHCSVLARQAIRNALRDYEARRGKQRRVGPRVRKEIGP